MNRIHKSLMAEDKETLDSNCGQFSCFHTDGLGLGFGMGNLILSLLLLSERRAAYGIHPAHTSIFHHHPPLLSPL